MEQTQVWLKPGICWVPTPKKYIFFFNKKIFSRSRNLSTRWVSPETFPWDREILPRGVISPGFQKPKFSPNLLWLVGSVTVADPDSYHLVPGQSNHHGMGPAPGILTCQKTFHIFTDQDPNRFQHGFSN